MAERSGSIGGYIFLKQDTIHYMENRVDLSDGWPGKKVVLSRQEEFELRRLKEDVSLLKECEEMILQLSAEVKRLKES